MRRTGGMMGCEVPLSLGLASFSPATTDPTLCGTLEKGWPQAAAGLQEGAEATMEMECFCAQVIGWPILDGHLTYGMHVLEYLWVKEQQMVPACIYNCFRSWKSFYILNYVT